MARVIDDLSLKKALRKKIFNKWINIRTNAFVKTWVQIKKKTHTQRS